MTMTITIPEWVLWVICGAVAVWALVVILVMALVLFGERTRAEMTCPLIQPTKPLHSTMSTGKGTPEPATCKIAIARGMCKEECRESPTA